jgi:nitroimidazol reductase NimA-like FMN-containing flavoprotein (pyridoxamine 5'-phosphate oxidase superfamily)
MTGLRWVQLSPTERAELLDTGGTGVLSFGTAADEPPASFPISYGYDSDSEVFYFRLSFPPGSKKDALIDNPVSFVTHADMEDGWQSVVATGHLESLSELPYESVAVQGMWAVQIPTVDIFEKPPAEVQFHDYCLDPDTITGRKEAV